MKKLYCYSNPVFCNEMQSRGWGYYLPDDSAVISINGTPDVQDYYGNHFALTDRHWFRKPLPNVLNISFDDIDTDTLVIDQEHTAHGISVGQARNIVEFIDAHRECDFYIHCHAGRSRSQAVVQYILDFIDGPWETRSTPSTYNMLVYGRLRDAKFGTPVDKND